MSEVINSASINYELDPAYDNLSGVNRYERALDILKNSRAVKKVGKGVYTVKSQQGYSVYTVVYDEKSGQASCNCPDCMKHIGEFGWECKHILAVKIHVNNGKKARAESEEPKRDWSSYNVAQMTEGEAFKVYLKQLSELADELADELAPKKNSKMGRPSLPLSELVFCAVMKVSSGLSSRRASVLSKNAEEENLIENNVHYNSVNKFMVREDVTPILRELVRLSASPLSSIEHDFAIDSSGFRLNQYGDWCTQKHDVKRAHDFVKCHISSGVLSNIIADVVITPSSGEGTADVKNFANLLEGTTGHFKVEQVSADKGYLSSANYTAAAKMHVEPFIMFKKNSKATGSSAWNKAFINAVNAPEEWLSNYHKRSNVESTFGALKERYGETLKSKTYTGQVNEILCKVIAYNISVVHRANVMEMI